jgi:tetratricopeptide (TPR) repeat protein
MILMLGIALLGLSPPQLLGEVEAGRGQEVLSDLLAVMREPGADAVFVQAAARVERDAGHYALALRILDEGLRLHIGSSALLYDRALTLALDGRYLEALRELDRCIQAGSSRPAELLRARVMLWAGQREASLTAFQRLVVANAGDVEALLGVADAQFALESLEEAKRSYLRIIELAPGNVSAIDGVRRLNQVPRLSAELRAGALWSAAAPSPVLQLRMQYLLVSRHTAWAEYQLDVLGVVEPGAGRLVHSTSAGWIWRTNANLTLNGALRYVSASQFNSIQLPIEAAVKMNKHLTVFALLRPGVSLNDEALQVLGAIGVQVAMPGGRWVMTQCFVSRDSKRSFSVVAAAAAELQPWPAIGVRLSASGGVTESGPALAANLEIAGRLAPQWELLVSQQSMVLPWSNHRALVGLRVSL